MFATALKTSEREDWNTPDEVLAPVRAFAGDDGIRLDPCGNAHSIVGAKLEYRLDRGDDGLKESWWGRKGDLQHGVVYVNPPYGRGVVLWLAKADTEHEDGVDDIFVLTAARTDTAAFQEHGFRATAICFWKGRITFRGATAPAPFPTAMLYWGSHVYRFGDVFSKYGHVVLP